MGLFKEMRALRKTVKATRRDVGGDRGPGDVLDDAGGAGGLAGILGNIPGAVSQGLNLASGVHEGQAELQRLIAEGIPATATFITARDTGVAIGSRAFAQHIADIDLDVLRDGDEPYRVTVRQMIPRLSIGRLVPGATLAIKVDASDPTRAAIDWNAG